MVCRTSSSTTLPIGEEHPNVDPEQMADTGGEARLPRYATDVRQPTPEERREHVKFHLPYRNWCKKCVEAKGRDLPHRPVDRTQDGCGICGADFFYWMN